MVLVCAVFVPSRVRALAPSGQQGADISAYEGKIVKAILLPSVPQADREHMLGLIPQKAGVPLDRNQVRDSMRVLYATGRFADIQAEAAPSGEEVWLTFSTSENFFIGAVDVEGAPARPNGNQIVNAAKFQLGELYSQEKLNRALENIRQLMQENGYYQARVTAERTSGRRAEAGPGAGSPRRFTVTWSSATTFCKVDWT